LLREPLLHFFAVGALLFGAYGVMHQGSANSPDEIVVSRGQLQNLQLQFERVWQRPATGEELQALIDNWVKEEIFYREGVNLGLDRDDAVVRRRIGQKLEFIVESAAPSPPTDAELQAWLDAHASDYQIEPTYSLHQVYFDPARHNKVDSVIAAARRALAAGKLVAGDATMLPSSVDAVSASEAQRVFGGEFVGRLSALPVGGWQGPVPSTFGVHLVALTRHDPARLATLAEARAEVERDLSHARLQQANAAFYDKLRAKYAVRIEGAGAVAEPAG
jgi:parvulin-like peptidyl-prolyl isomerase